MSDRRSFWTTLPGILTGVAAIITAVATLLNVLPESKKEPRTNSDLSPAPQTAEPEGGYAEIAVPTVKPESVPATATRIQAGDKVLAIWEGDGCFYSASVLGVSNSQYRVHYEFSDSALVNKQDIVPQKPPEPSSIGSAARVFVRMPSENEPWVPGYVAEISNGGYLVVLDESSPCGADKRNTRVHATDIVVSE